MQIPEAVVEEGRGAKCGKCCEDQMVLADLTSNDTHKNDFTGVYAKKGTASDVIAFTMERCDETVVSNEGLVGVFPNDSLAVGYIYNWKSILSTHGVGKYNIRITFTIAGITNDFIVGAYELKKFTRENVKDSVRIYSEFNSYYQKEDIDFTGSNFKDTVRFNGFFGNRDPETEINNLIDKGRKVVKVTRENLNKYTLRTDPVNIGMTRQLLDKHFINEDIIKFSDYNRFNHDFNIFDQECVLIDTPKVEYLDLDRRAEITAVFGDRKLQDKSYYRGN